MATVKEPHDPFKLAFIFKDVSLTRPANKELAEWLDYMTEHHIKELHFLYRASQEYVKHGGGSVYTQANWNKRLIKNVTIALKEYNSGK